VLAKIKFRESLTVHTVLDRCRHLSDLHGERNTDALMGWICFILLIVWAVWTVLTNIGKIVTFLALAICGIVAAFFGILAFEWVIIGLANGITFIQDHGWMALLSISGIVAAVFVMFRLRDVPVVHYTASNQHDDQ
jgi:hypothetical protein